MLDGLGGDVDGIGDVEGECDDIGEGVETIGYGDFDFVGGAVRGESRGDLDNNGVEIGGIQNNLGVVATAVSTGDAVRVGLSAAAIVGGGREGYQISGVVVSAVECNVAGGGLRNRIPDGDVDLRGVGGVVLRDVGRAVVVCNSDLERECIAGREFVIGEGDDAVCVDIIDAPGFCATFGVGKGTRIAAARWQ